ncbi:MFS transporter [Streptomyces sp. MUM 203J]|uniref:MFS transporter n=1 Tax=Streptomyces sp. MUM 203J TaxID=2791990 RepID=UPI001F04918F|nr:MFS transporter [Streptomyces sp. MUM 203J]MCH0539319.1 MFS transporter [Streptomyces sp. MUM 203J]
MPERDTNGTSGTAAASRLPVPPARRNLAAATSGHALEWYDWNVYAMMAPFFSTAFFVAGDGTSALLSSLAVFAVGFVARPVGGLVFGVLSDRLGRRTAMLWSVALMAGGSLLIAVTPAYGTIGVLAPVLLVLARLAQGLSAGGEFAASAAYLVEAAPPRRKGFYSSFLYTGNAVGTLIAAAVGALLAFTLGPGLMASWGWRVPFLIGGVAAVSVGFLRRGMDETLHRPDAGTGPASTAAAPGIRHLAPLKQHRGAVFTLCGLTAGATVVYYTWVVALPAQAIQSGRLGPAQTLLAAAVAQVVLLLALPFVGMLADRVGTRPLLLVFTAGFTVLGVPLYALAQTSLTGLFVSEAVGLILFSGYGATAAAVMAGLFPAGARGTGIGLPYAATVAAFGGTAPYAGVWLADSGLDNAFAGYVSVLCAVAFVITFFRIGRPSSPAPAAQRIDAL